MPTSKHKFGGRGAGFSGQRQSGVPQIMKVKVGSTYEISSPRPDFLKYTSSYWRTSFADKYERIVGFDAECTNVIFNDWN